MLNLADDPADLGRLPILVEAQPTRGTAGERIVLRGFGFDPEPGGNAVTFGESRALVVDASPTELVVSAPAGGVVSRQQKLRIVVEAKGRIAGRTATRARATFRRRRDRPTASFLVDWTAWSLRSAR